MRLFRSFRHSALLALLVACFAMPALAADEAEAAATANAILDQLDAGDFDTVTAQFNAQMKAALDRPQLQAVQQQIEAAGPVTSRDPARVAEQDGYTVVMIRVHREQASLDATVAIDNDGKIAGLHFAPVAAGG
ncbi:DUF3887 domain-containing protein [Luteimonas sp. BDR2-5]|uniref:DUF3887 domain-containing protein n=1 Tax=Proluteimonas luteida TaxID=2878685 RepID=UPI001E5A3C73|nr:DUF3887 domain-containing protein [Luteimonas sp. BDR2-5]MCD9028154.1 DUF3887 domain-containing protein [Luteimonas sp. BDR2-5]